jgi:hypothetical protein
VTFAEVIEDASMELTAVESAVGTARHVLDVAATTERVAGRVIARARIALVIALVVLATLGVAYAIMALRARRATESGARVEEQPDVIRGEDVH